jgi:antitoxin ParD1/3/4
MRTPQRCGEDALKLKALRMRIEAGLDALDRGEFVEVDDAELDDYLEGLTAPPGYDDQAYDATR